MAFYALATSSPGAPLVDVAHAEPGAAERNERLRSAAKAALGRAARQGKQNSKCCRCAYKAKADKDECVLQAQRRGRMGGNLGQKCEALCLAARPGVPLRPTSGHFMWKDKGVRKLAGTCASARAAVAAGKLKNATWGARECPGIVGGRILGTAARIDPDAYERLRAACTALPLPGAGGRGGGGGGARPVAAGALQEQHYRLVPKIFFDGVLEMGTVCAPLALARLHRHQPSTSIPPPKAHRSPSPQRPKPNHRAAVRAPLPPRPPAPTP